MTHAEEKRGTQQISAIDRCSSLANSPQVRDYRSSARFSPHRPDDVAARAPQHGNQAAETRTNPSARPPILISLLDLHFANQLQQPEVVGQLAARHLTDHLQLDEPHARRSLSPTLALDSI
ncbi:hypothetical protein DVH05_019452 [Phytophthora capsici]|nr:hypothetical protein DVH05_019452 [Phytophthora capsici]